MVGTTSPKSTNRGARVSQSTERLAPAAEPEFKVQAASIHKIEADGVRVFYRAAKVPGIFPPVEAAVTRDLGQERSLLHSRRSRSISERPAGREDSVP